MKDFGDVNGADESGTVYQIAQANASTVQTIRFDPLDELVLGVARHLFMQPDSSQHPSWKAGFRLADRVFVSYNAALFLQTMWRVVHEISGTRPSRFNFVTPEDVHARHFVTPEERNLVQLLHFLRIGDRIAAQTQLIVLCEGRDGRDLMMQAKKVAELLRLSPDPEVRVQQKIS